jgi:flagellar basal-body rod protein FlgG
MTMLRALTAAATGMVAQQTRLDVTANNIANVATPGFKKGRAEFSELLVQVQREPGAPTEGGSAPSGLEVGMGVRAAGTSRSFSQGNLQQTGNPLDLAVEGSGFFPLRMPGGETAYTRDGAFRLNLEGQLVTRDGHPLAAEVMVPPDAQEIAIAPDGTVTAVQPGDPTPLEVGRIELAAFPNPGGLTALGRNLFKETAASGAPIAAAPGEHGTGPLTQGALELSNVQVVEEMIDLIAGQRAYEINARVVRAADEMLQQASNLR